MAGAAENSGSGAGRDSFNLDYELAPGEDPRWWADQLKRYLAAILVPPGTAFSVFPDDREPGMEWRNVCVFGEDLRRTDDPVELVRGITRRWP